MPDYAQCQDSTCPQRDQCARYLMVPSEWRQAYYMESPRKGGECVAYWPTYRGAPFRLRNVDDADAAVRTMATEASGE